MPCQHPTQSVTSTFQHGRDILEYVTRKQSTIPLDGIPLYGIESPMIRSFACPETEAIFQDRRSRYLPSTIMRVARRKLLTLHAARILDDLRVPPGNRLEPLHGNRKGQYSIRINDQWRLCFRFDSGHASHVEIVDYHRA